MNMMQSTRAWLAAPLMASLLALSATAPASAAEQNGLVNVDISNVRTEIAKNIDVDVSQVPVTVQVPVGVAANVCGVDANVLAQQKKGSTASCQAQNTSTALNQIVQKRAS